MKNKLITLAKENNIDLEILETKVNTTDINVLNGKNNLFQINDVSSYLIKAIKDNKFVKLITENIENADEIIGNIQKIFSIQDNDNANTLAEGKIKNEVKDRENIDYSEVIKDLESLEKLKEQYPQIVTIESSYTHYDNCYYIDNENASLTDETYYNEYGVSISVEKDGIKRITYAVYYSTHYDFESFKEYILTKLDDLIVKLNSDSCKTDKYNIILKNNAVASILKSFADSFNSKAIYLKESVLTDKLNTKIFNEKINIVEDPQNGILKRHFDTEGTKTKYKELIKNGVFIKQINNKEYAMKLKEETTGNAYGVNNLYIQPEDNSYEELIKELNNGIIIDEVQGLHSGIELKTGNISLQAEGLLVENGKIVKGLNMIILSTNLFELFSNVDKIGNDMSKTLSVLAPSLLIKNITIAGKE